MSTATDADSLRRGSRQGSPLRCAERAAKNCGAPLTAASLRLGGSYGERPLPRLQKRQKVDCRQQPQKVCPRFALQAIFRNGARLALSPDSSQTDKLLWPLSLAAPDH